MERPTPQHDKNNIGIARIAEDIHVTIRPLAVIWQLWGFKQSTIKHSISSRLLCPSQTQSKMFQEGALHSRTMQSAANLFNSVLARLAWPHAVQGPSAPRNYITTYGDRQLHVRRPLNCLPGSCALCIPTLGRLIGPDILSAWHLWSLNASGIQEPLS